MQQSRLFFPSLPDALRNRLRTGLAWICLTMALVCLGAGLSPSVPATAGTDGERPAETDALSLPGRLLQATVDSAALSLAGVLADLPDPSARRAALAGALNALAFDPGSPVYFTAWEQTRLLHSPLTPDTEDQDFAQALDARGTPFVRDLDALGEAGGGFLHIFLPRHIFDKERPAAAPLAAAAGALLSRSAPAPEAQEEARLVYIRGISGTSWRIGAFMPLPAGAPLPPPGSPPRVWDIPATREEGFPEPARGAFFLTGLSFLGLAGVFFSVRGRRSPCRRSACPPQ